MIRTIEDTSLDILQAKKPVIYLDTCSLVDIIRSPIPNDIHFSHVVGAKDLLNFINQNKIYTVSTITVEIEFTEHQGKESLNLERWLNKLEQNNTSLINSLELMGVSFKFNLKGFSDLKLNHELSSLAKNILNSSFILEKDEECSHKAHTRVEQNLAPSSPGKSESKDCLIIEHFLKLSKKLRDNNFEEKIIFISSNKKDFGKPPDNLNVPLKREFSELDIKYVNNIQWALKEVDLLC